MRLVGHKVRTWKFKNESIISVGKTERKIPLGRPRRRWDDVIKTDLK
jgi:hypothetical protein